MLVFRKGAWITVEVPSSDPTLSTVHHQRMAAAVASGVSLASAEAELYADVFGSGILREQHNSPKHEEK